MTLRHRLLPAKRRSQLKELMASKRGLRIIEAHNGISALVATTTIIQDENGIPQEFDGLWVSSLTDSAAKGHPDTEVIDTSSRLQTIQELLQVTNKPIIVDGDTGGQPTQFEYFCSKLENMGVSAVIIEDKKYPKRNSLEKDAIQNLEDPNDFATKINRAKDICLSDDFMIFTRIESFIAGRGLEDAIHRADIYLDSKADGIFIHSNIDTTEEIYAFMDAYEKLCKKKGFYKPVVCVPTTYNTVTDKELFQKGFSIVIYANHLLRAAHKAMKETCKTILKKHRSYETLNEISTIKEILEEVGFPDVKSKDAKYEKNSTPIIILGSGKPEGFSKTLMESLPVSSIPIAGRSLLERQLSTLKEIGLTKITLLSGYGRDKLPKTSVEEIYNENYGQTKVANFLMMAKEKFSNGFIMIFGDIIFDKNLLTNYLLNIKSDVLLLVDNSFNLQTRKSIKPTTDLVILSGHDNESFRKPNMLTEFVHDIGSAIPLEDATHEFVGIAKFSKHGAEQLENAYKKIPDAQKQQLDFNTLIKGLIADGTSVEALQINHGWSEVHNLSDIAAIEKDIIRRAARTKKENYVA